MGSDGEGSGDEGELDYFTGKRSFGFLLGLDDGEGGKSNKKAKSDKPKEEPAKTTEEAYAEKRYNQEKGKPAVDLVHMLPIKTDKGVLQERSRVVKKEAPKEPAKAEKAPEPEEPPPTSVAEVYALRQQYITKAKQDIAKMCCAITEDPYNNVAAMRKLRAYCSTEDCKAGRTIRKLAIVSLTSIYNDILPAYTVKPSEELDTLSKEVKVQHSYETELLRNYRVYLELLLENLNQAFQTKKDRKTSEEAWESKRNLGYLSLKCMAELLANNYNFNLRTNLVHTLLPYGAGKHMGGKLAEVITTTVKDIFDNDKQGECSVEIVRMIASLVKKKGSNVNGDLLECLIHVRLVELGEAKKAKQETLEDTAMLSHKQRKHRKKQAKVRQEMLEAQAVESKKKQGRLQSESLDHIFVTFFRVLKQYHSTHLLPIALAGLSKFAHLINVDFFTDLFECLKRIIREDDEMSLADSLNCVSTIFTILSGQGSVLDVDIGEFYSLLYQNLLHLSPSTPLSTFSLLRKTLHNAAKRQVPIACQMAMVKRLCTVSTSLLPHQSHTLITEARKIMRGSPRISQMLAPDEDFGRPFRPDVAEPGQANAEGCVLWELSSLAKCSFHESVRTAATHLSRFDPDSAKRAEIEYFLKEKFKKNDFVILEEDFPKGCKKMQNRRTKVPESLSDTAENGLHSLDFANHFKVKR